jgi:hypothetical protein
VVATFDGNELVLYIDANPVASTRNGNGIPDSGAVAWTIGHQNCDCTGGYVGMLDEVAVYTAALPADRVGAHYAAARR